MKYCTSSGMSSRRSASEGTRIGTTERRWNRSSRKRPVGDRLGEVAAGRGDDAHVDMNARRAADALEILVDQHAQDLGLRLQRHVGDFVEIERAAVRLLERADAPRPIGAGLDAEQFALHVVGRDRRRVEDDERPLGAHRMGVDQPRRQFLARPRRARKSGRANWPGRAVRSTRFRLAIAEEAPTMRLAAPERARSSLTSRLSREVSSARSAIRISRSALNGFSMKS